MILEAIPLNANVAKPFKALTGESVCAVQRSQCFDSEVATKGLLD